ncbi:hypothetical protein LEP3755_26910 [Leptolyngbya sp. NIES-3755]|nr:hypothetical protein LEP3755_26910 [Leptolyngbya sp. NIES-3755]
MRKFTALFSRVNVLAPDLGNLPIEQTRTLAPTGETYGIRGITQLESPPFN